MRTHGELRTRARWTRAAQVVLGLAVAASCWGALAVAQGPGRMTTYAGGSGLAAALTIATGAALGLAGLATALGGSRRIGVLTMLAGLIWFAPVWAGWEQGPLLVRSIGMATAGLVLPLLAHVMLAYPTGRLPTLAARAVVVTAYAGTAVFSVALTLVRDPFFDPYCWANCTGNVFVVRPMPEAARVVVAAERWFTVIVAVAVAALCLRRVMAASPPARRVLVPVAAPALLLAGAVAARGVSLLSRPVEDPSEPAFRDAFVLQCLALLMLATALVSALVWARLQHQAVARILSTVGEAPAPGSLEAALARAVGDPELRIAYWLPGVAQYVDASGRSVAAPTPGPGRLTTTLVRGDQRVAVVSHATDGPEIGSAMGAAFTLALDNERLQAESLAQIEELRASRSRIVETGDQERQRLERDLHDGAQQQLLTASYEIRLAISSAASEGDVPTATNLSAALEGTLASLEELRALAHGLYPAILGEAGLAAALTTFADTAPVLLDTRRVTEERCSAAAEVAAYQLVVDCVEDAVARHASGVVVEAAARDGMLVVTVSDDGTEPLTALVWSADRVGALGGTLGGTLESDPKVRRAEIPCA